MPDRQCAVIPRNRYRHDLKAMAEAVTAETKLIFIENPDNPTGTWISHDELANFLTRIPENIIVVADEAYYEYARYALGADYPDTLSLQKKYPNLITLRTFSKAYGLAGLRTGYALLCPELANILNQSRLKMSVTSPALIAACAALKDAEHLERTLKNNEAGMKYLEISFAEMNIAYIPSAANFITFDAGENARIIFEKLRERNILISPLEGFGLPPNFLRVTAGLAEENRAFIENLRDVMQQFEM
jgi:histidinol-phosphate aminotransferase